MIGGGLLVCLFLGGFFLQKHVLNKTKKKTLGDGNDEYFYF
jgi:hypothetical protein